VKSISVKINAWCKKVQETVPFKRLESLKLTIYFMKNKEKYLM